MAKVAARYRAREVLLNETDYPNLKFVWVESCRKRRKQDVYDLVLRTEESLTADDVDHAAKLFGADPSPLSSGYEDGCECCGGGSSYIEFDLSGATLPA